MNSDRKQAWKFLGELTGGGILFAACLLALLQAPYWNRPASLDELRVERALRLSKGDAPYHVFVGNSLLHRAIDLGMMQNETRIQHATLRAPGGRIHDVLFALEDLLESEMPPARLYLQAGLMTVTGKKKQYWRGGTWSSFGRVWPQTWNKLKASVDHLDWQRDAFDLVHPKISELYDFERFIPDFVEAIFSPPIQEPYLDSLSFFSVNIATMDCLDDDYPLDSIETEKLRHFPSPPPDYFEGIFRRLHELAVAANTEVFWLTTPKLEGMDTADPALMETLRSACQTFSWTLVDIASDKKFKQRPGYYQKLPNLSNRTNLHLCPEGQRAYTEELIRRLRSQGPLRPAPSHE